MHASLGLPFKLAHIVCHNNKTWKLHDVIDVSWKQLYKYRLNLYTGTSLFATHQKTWKPYKLRLHETIEQLKSPWNVDLYQRACHTTKQNKILSVKFLKSTFLGFYFRFWNIGVNIEQPQWFKQAASQIHDTTNKLN
jgi:hypothetical protein